MFGSQKLQFKQELKQLTSQQISSTQLSLEEEIANITEQLSEATEKLSNFEATFAHKDADIQLFQAIYQQAIQQNNQQGANDALKTSAGSNQFIIRYY